MKGDQKGLRRGQVSLSAFSETRCRSHGDQVRVLLRRKIQRQQEEKRGSRMQTSASRKSLSFGAKRHMVLSPGPPWTSCAASRAQLNLSGSPGSHSGNGGDIRLLRGPHKLRPWT